MVGSSEGHSVHHHHLMDDGNGGDVEGLEQPPSSGSWGVSCSICFDLVSYNGGRSRAKLQCGHEFHLDCIGSAFNVKGVMQCPNCRKVEKGQWLYANGSTQSFPESLDDWIPDEDPYDLSYTEMPFRIHWCPFGELAQIHSSFEEVESPPTTYPNLQGHHAMFADQSTAPSVPQSYVTYLRPVPLASSRSNDNVDNPNLNNPWNGLTGQNEIFNPQTFPSISIQYQSWGHHSPPVSLSAIHINNANPASNPSAAMRPGESDAVERSRSHLIRFGHGSAPRVGSSFVMSVVPQPPDTIARPHDRMQAFHHHQQQHRVAPGVPSPIIPSVRRFEGPAVLPSMVSAPPQPDVNAGFYMYPPARSSEMNLHEAENPFPSQFHAWRRERPSHFPTLQVDWDSSGWGSSRHTNTGSDSANRHSNLWHRSWS
ncbi:hypothetical protein FEM48_Zijuj09G0023600 [Ziziphus jujuba var. spinosa]|uniref:RING-type domain-containing protein n=1 Tax=Ziziphus jujuba var. spinosa TaxID=714518 RepID=A0A978UQC4_ZIZJJ|nr:hypothetical protein FEM48_Zijuj09G0023600 [Ziziphus jujuba var. spinosa]